MLSKHILSAGKPENKILKNYYYYLQSGGITAPQVAATRGQQVLTHLGRWATSGPKEEAAGLPRVPGVFLLQIINSLL